jgi:hypothetical protein
MIKSFKARAISRCPEVWFSGFFRPTSIFHHLCTLQSKTIHEPPLVKKEGENVGKAGSCPTEFPAIAMGNKGMTRRGQGTALLRKERPKVIISSNQAAAIINRPEGFSFDLSSGP